MARRSTFAALVAMLLAAHLWAQAGSDPASKGSKDGYLVVRCDEKKANYYDLTRFAQFMEPQRYSKEFFRKYQPPSARCLGIGFDIGTEHTVRYGVYQAWKVRIVGTTDSVKMPASTKDSVYVLSYARNPDWIFCAKKYSFVPLNDGARKIIYTDFQDGKDVVMDLSADWPRPWQIFEIEILRAHALPEIWEASKHPIPSSPP
jgi:hypothetical protein